MHKLATAVVLFPFLALALGRSTAMAIPQDQVAVYRVQLSPAPAPAGNMHLLRAGVVPHIPATRYTVRAGDSLTRISVRVYGAARYWPVLYWSNRLHWADKILVGQVLVIPPLPAHIPARPAALAPVPSSQTYPGEALNTGTAYSPVLASSGQPSGPWPGGAFGACVVARESGGNAQVMNASGHYGLYQFSLATWEKYGGSAATFGRATVVEQETVFMAALAEGGQSNWSPYDGC